jgi:CheY-like chemotaxis protein
MQGDDEKAKAAGCTDYLTKPVDEDLLLRKLKEYLG